MNRTTKNLIMLVVIIVVLGGALAASAMISDRNSNKADNSSMFTVQRGILAINLTETGTIKSRDQFVVKSEVEGRTSIIYVIDEGIVVKEGDLLLIQADSKTVS
jgi:HlyD family secretion protein